MAKKKNGKKVWITGAVLGAVAGAAYALWKTPMSGEELRGKLSSGPVAQRDEVRTNSVYTPSVVDRLLSKVEQTLAPIVGVQPGKTANGPAPTGGAVTEPISVPPPTPAAVDTAVAEPVKEHGTMTRNDDKARKPNEPEDPKFEAADAEPDPGQNAPTDSSDTIRSKRFAWGSPTPEAGVQPVPTEPMEEDPVTEPANMREPAAPSRIVPPGDGGYGKDRIRSQQFSWGEPTPDSTREHDEDPGVETNTSQPVTDQLATAGAATAGEDRPLDPVSSEAAVNKNAKREFPPLGGLEHN